MTSGNNFMRNRVAAIIWVGLLSFAGCLLVSQMRGIPVPTVYDEFSYLLAGETFASGRMTNPPHPMWPHFETFHELMQPTYMSKYPPGQGIFLAIGKIIFGHAIYGVWLSVALMCSAICWMLYAWVPARWALLGGLVSVLQFGAFTYWSQSYWGGAVAALGGALMFGALPRLLKTQRLIDALWLGLGFIIVANSRPVESILVGIPAGILLLTWRQQVLSQIPAVRKMWFLGWAAAVIFLTLIAVGFYNKTITGQARIFPHSLFAQSYSSVPLTVWQPLRPPVHIQSVILANYESAVTQDYFLSKRTWKGFWASLGQDIARLFGFYFGHLIGIAALLAIVLYFRSGSWMRRCAGGVLIIGLAAASMHCRALPHYFAALTCVAIMLMVTGLRVLSLIRIRKDRLGPVLVGVLLVVQLGLNVVLPPNKSVDSIGRSLSGNDLALPKEFTRQQLIDLLINKGGQHLVIIKQQLAGYREWVFNAANIDQAPVVWARDLGEDKNARLRAYFKDHQVHYIEVSRRGKDFDQAAWR